MIWFCIAQALKLNSSILTWYVLSTSKLTRLNEKTVESLNKSVGDAGKMKLECERRRNSEWWLKAEYLRNVLSTL